MEILMAKKNPMSEVDGKLGRREIILHEEPLGMFFNFNTKFDKVNTEVGEMFLSTLLVER